MILNRFEIRGLIRGGANLGGRVADAAQRPFHALHAIGDRVQAGEISCEVGGSPVHRAIAGGVRGKLHDGIQSGADIKIGDVDPRWEREYCDTISD